jgi:oligopeptide/dipeptide ABC transporter ATP-binding protein
LSGGQRQRVALARALIAEPDLILCDEILSALDVSVQAGVLALLARIRAERGLALLFITHDLAVVRGFADRVLVLFAGTIVQEAAAAALFAGARHPYAAALIAAAPRLVPAARPAPQPEPPPPPAPPAAAAGACVYLARCPHRRSVCGESPPPARPLPGGGMLRCHIPVDELAREAPDSRDGPGEARH